MNTLLTIIAFLIIFSVLILVHEWGHFYAARRSGIKVEEFGIGLPPRIWGKKVGEVLYSVNWIPFGGFVRMLGEDPTDANARKSSRSFMRKSLWQRTKVVCAGVFMNFFLAWVLLSAGFMLGMQPLIVNGDEFLEGIRDGRIEVVAGEVNDQVFELPRVVIYSALSNDFFESGDVVLRVNGQEMFFATEFQEELEGLSALSVFLLRGEEIVEVIVGPYDYLPVADVVMEGADITHLTVISDISQDSPAELAGLQALDRVISVNGMEIIEPEDVLGVLDSADEILTYKIQRGEEILSFDIGRNEEGLIGVYLAKLMAPPDSTLWFYDGLETSSVVEITDVQYPWYEAPVQSLVEMKRISIYTAIMIGKVFGNIFATGDVPEGVAGPVGIAQMTGFYLEEGFVALMRFTALLSLSLAVINIFPFPALDGGRMMFIIIEAVRGKPVDARIEGFIHALGFLLLMAIILLVTFNDVQRLFQ